MSASRISSDNHSTNNASKLEEDYHNNLELLQKQRDEVKKLTEMLNTKDRSLAEMGKKELTYKHCMHKIQVQLLNDLSKLFI